jgi:hypothetical protein
MATENRLFDLRGLDTSTRAVLACNGGGVIKSGTADPNRRSEEAD